LSKDDPNWIFSPFDVDDDIDDDDHDDCHLAKIRLRGTNLCAGGIGRFVFDDDWFLDLLKCNSDETRFCLLDSGQIQARNAFKKETKYGFWEAHEDYQVLLQNSHGGASQVIKFRSNGKIKTGIGQCLTVENTWSPEVGDRVMTTKCSYGSRWELIDLDGDDDDDDPKQAVLVKLERKQWGSSSHRPDGEYCMVCEDVEDGSKMKLKLW